MSKEFKKVLLIVWFVLTVLTSATLIVPLIFSKETVLRHTPACMSKSLHHQECFLCGTTTAFTEISSGNFKNAYHLNKLSPFIYSFFLVNLCFFTFLVRKYN